MACNAQLFSFAYFNFLDYNSTPTRAVPVGEKRIHFRINNTFGGGEEGVPAEVSNSRHWRKHVVFVARRDGLSPCQAAQAMPS